MKNNNIIKLIALLIPALFIQQAYADGVKTSIGNFQASSSLNSTCVVSATNIVYGTVGLNLIDPLNRPGASGSMTTKCSFGVPYTISFTPDLSLIGQAAFRGTMHGSIVGNNDTINGYVFLPNGQTSQTGTGTGIDQTITLTSTLVANSSTNNGMPTPDTYSTNVSVNIAY